VEVCFPGLQLGWKKSFGQSNFESEKKLLSKEKIISKTRDPPINEMQIHL